MKRRRFAARAAILVNIVVLLAGVLPTAVMGASDAVQLQAVYDLNWQLRYYLKENTLYDLDWQAFYYLRDNSVYDLQWIKRYYLKENNLYDLNWQLRYYIREYRKPGDTGDDTRRRP